MKTRFVFASPALMLSLALLLASLMGQAQAQLTASQPYFMIVNQNSGKCLDLIGGNTANGANINQYTYDANSANQRWALLPTENSNHFKLISFVSGKAMSIANDSTGTGAQL